MPQSRHENLMETKSFVSTLQSSVDESDELYDHIHLASDVNAKMIDVKRHTSERKQRSWRRN